MLLFAAFLFLPLFVFLFALIAFNAPVFETIYTRLINFKKLVNLSCNYLTCCYHYVKQLYALYILSLAISCIISPLRAHTITISNGQHFTKPKNLIKSYTIGNKEILKSTYSKDSDSILFKGIKIGHTQVLLWDYKDKVTTLDIFVIPKRRVQKLKSLQKLIRSNNLNAIIKRDQLYVSGTLINFNQYLLIKKMQSEYDYFNINKVTIDKRTRNHFLYLVYQYFWKENIDHIRCEYSNVNFTCFYPKETSPGKGIAKILRSKLFINLVPLNNYQQKLYCMNIQLFEKNVTHSGSREVNRPFIQISAKKGTPTYLSPTILNQSEIQNKNNLISNNKIILTNGKKSSFKTGMSINKNLKSFDQEHYSQHIKYFTGIESEFEIINHGKKTLLNIKSTISSPTEKSGEFKKSKVESSLPVKMNHKIEFFSLIVESQQKFIQSPSFLSSVPIISLLKKKNTSRALKKYWGEIFITENCFHDK